MANQGDVIENPRTGQRMQFLLTDRDTKGELLRIDCTSRPGGVKEPEHVHPFQENRFEVLSGYLTFSIDGQERKAGPGEVIAIPPNTPHFFWNDGSLEAHYIQEFRPALRSEYFFEALFNLAREGKLNEQGTASPLLMAAFIPRFWDEIRVTKPPQIVQKVFFALLVPVSKLLGHRVVSP